MICRKKSLAQEPKVILVGHMDEIGFMVKLITKEGFVRFTPLEVGGTRSCPGTGCALEPIKVTYLE